MKDTITDRQLQILRHLNQVESASRAELTEVITGASRITVIRDLNHLVAGGLVVITGRGPATAYSVTQAGKRLRLYDPAVYLRQEPDSRRVQFTDFGIDRLESIRDAVTTKEIDRIGRLVNDYRLRRGSNVASRELERFTIELSWKSSKIEGNTYSLLDTEQLIKNSVEAAGHSREEAMMILNHKLAFDHIWQHHDSYKQLRRASIDDIHQLLTQGLGIGSGLRQLSVGIVGTAYAPPASQIEISSHLNRLAEIVNDSPEPMIKGLIALVGISYLQPFADGNKRTARLVSNALLLAHNYPPLSYRTVDENAFKGALILFYEQGAAGYIIDLYTQQLEFSAKNYNL